jgi:hypothetical protein
LRVSPQQPFPLEFLLVEVSIPTDETWGQL